MSDLKDKRPLAKARVQVVAQTKSRLLPATVGCKPVLQESPAIKHNAVPPARATSWVNDHSKKILSASEAWISKPKLFKKPLIIALGTGERPKIFVVSKQQFAKVAWTCWTGRTVKRVAIARASQPTRPRLSLVFPMISPSQIKTIQTFPHVTEQKQRNKQISFRQLRDHCLLYQVLHCVCSTGHRSIAMPWSSKFSFQLLRPVIRVDLTIYWWWWLCSGRPATEVQHDAWNWRRKPRETSMHMTAKSNRVARKTSTKLVGVEE